MKKALLTLLLLASALCAQPAKTTVTDTLPAAFTGANNNGSLTITWPAFTSSAYTVAQSPARGISVPITNGAFTVALVPTDHSTTAVTYTVTVNIAGNVMTLAWSVPTLPSSQCHSSSLCTLQEVTVALPSGPAPLTFNASQISVGSSISGNALCNVGGITGWCAATGLTWAGTWSSSEAYVPNQVVFYNGSSYAAIQNGTNQNPATQSAYWQLFAMVGATGATGPTGPQGPTVYPAAGIAVSPGTSGPWSAALTAPSGTIVGTTDTQTLTNKTVDGVSPATMGYVDLTSSAQTQLNSKAPLASPALTGSPTAPTKTTGDSSTDLATDAFVAAAVAPLAPLASPALTGSPTAPTKTTGDSSTDLATDAFVAAAITPLAPLASPTFTGAPKAPTQSAGDASTDLATDAFVAAAAAQQMPCNNSVVSTVFCVTGSGNFATLATTYAYAVGLGVVSPVIYDFNFTYATPEVMYCSPWPNDDSLVNYPKVFLGPGVLQFNNHTAVGAACPSNTATFGAPKSGLIKGVPGTEGSSATTGTIIQAGSLWNTAASADCGLGNSQCLMPLVVVGNWTGSSYVSFAQVRDVTIDCNYVPGCRAVEIVSAQEDSSLYYVNLKNATQALYWHGSNAQNSVVEEVYDTGCNTASHCPVDGTVTRVEWDNVPSSRGLQGGTFNGGNNAHTWTVSSVACNGSMAPFNVCSGSTAPYTVTVNLTATMVVSTPVAPGTITQPLGGGSTQYSYKLVALQTFGKPTAASSATSTIGGAATLSASAYNQFSTTSTTTQGTGDFAYYAKVYRQTGGTGSYCYVGNVVLGQNFQDVYPTASTTDCTPSSTNLTGLLVNDWFCDTISPNTLKGCWQVSAVNSSTQFAYVQATTPGTFVSGTVALAPKKAVNICTGGTGTSNPCYDDIATANPMVATIRNAHFEHSAYGVYIDDGTGVGIGLEYSNLSTVSSNSATDLNTLLYVPAVAIKALGGCLLQGAATNTLYEDLNKSFSLTSGLTWDSCEAYNNNGNPLGYTALAPLASPAFTGTPTAPTQTASDNSTKLATDAFVAASFAPLASPALTGTPTAPTQTPGDNSTKIATDAFVARVALRPLASPALTGTPTAPTQTASDNSTDIATDAFVKTAVASFGPGPLYVHAAVMDTLCALGSDSTIGANTCNNTASITPGEYSFVQSYQFPANYFGTLGKTVTVDIALQIWSSSSASAVQFKLRFGGTANSTSATGVVIWNTTQTAPTASLVAKGALIHCIITSLSTTTMATECTGPNFPNFTNANNDNQAAQPVTVTTSSPETLTLSLTSGAATAGNQVQLLGMTVVGLN